MGSRRRGYDGWSGGESVPSMWSHIAGSFGEYASKSPYTTQAKRRRHAGVESEQGKRKRPLRMSGGGRRRRVKSRESSTTTGTTPGRKRSADGVRRSGGVSSSPRRRRAASARGRVRRGSARAAANHRYVEPSGQARRVKVRRRRRGV